MIGAAFRAGLIFALGLGLGGMTLPEKVIGFLDLFGGWDPSLLFVMAGAVATHFTLYRIIRRHEKPVFADQFRVPHTGSITPSLVGGAVLFGIGWGIAGYCPAPAIVALVSFRSSPVIFVGGMLAGFALHRLLPRRRSAAVSRR